MLHKLYLDNAFTHKNKTIEFDSGLTAIIGPNGTGKSLILEMVRYALYGSKALRGSAADYKKLHVELTFSVNQLGYKVIRKGSKQELYRGEEIIASGTSTVNKKIIEVMGYPLDVFDIANCANQDHLNALSNMKPQQRKTMVDDVVGLNVIDKLREAVSEKITALRAETVLIENNLVEPAEPQKPNNYQKTEILKNELENLNRKNEERNQLLGFLQAVPFNPGAKPVWNGLDISEIKARLDIQMESQGELQRLRGKFEGVGKPTLTAEQIKAEHDRHQGYNNYLQAKRFLDQFSTPPINQQAIDGQIRQWDAYNQWARKKQLIAQGETTCPNCQHHWFAAQEIIEREGLTDVQEITQPTYSVQDLQAFQRQWKALADNAAAITQAKAVPEVTMPQWTLPQLAIEEQNLSRWAEAQAAIDLYNRTLAELQQQPNYQQMNTDWLKYNHDLTTWNAHAQAYNTWLQQKAAKEIQLQSLENIPSMIQQMATAYQICATYEHGYQLYRVEMEKWKASGQKLQTQKAQLEQFIKAREALVQLKVTVKRYLVPSLNHVASHLIQQMTDGYLNTVAVDEEFDIVIDGKKIDTLSGSERAVANLAIRVALGQVLTNRRFSLFMADEIDGSMDADRAEATAEALRNLTKFVNQILLVSHKHPDANHYIELTR